MEDLNYVVVYESTSEKAIRQALNDGRTLELQPPEGTDTENAPRTVNMSGCSFWLRLVFTGKQYVYVYDNASGWSYSRRYDDNNKRIVADDGEVSLTLTPEVNYKLTGDISTLEVAFAGDEDDHYHFSFLSGSTAASLTLPSAIIMPPGFQVEANKRYEIDILDGYASAQNWSR